MRTDHRRDLTGSSLTTSYIVTDEVKKTSSHRTVARSSPQVVKATECTREIPKRITGVSRAHIFDGVDDMLPDVIADRGIEKKDYESIIAVHMSSSVISHPLFVTSIHQTQVECKVRRTNDERLRIRTRARRVSTHHRGPPQWLTDHDVSYHSAAAPAVATRLPMQRNFYDHLTYRLNQPYPADFTGVHSLPG